MLTPRLLMISDISADDYFLRTPLPLLPLRHAAIAAATYFRRFASRYFYVAAYMP